MHDKQLAHSHPHEHDGHSRGKGGSAKTAAVLAYTRTHNAQHAEELADLAHKLRGEGFAAAAAALDAAVSDFRSGNEKLSEALRLLNEAE
jgi:hypothetical protein